MAAVQVKFDQTGSNDWDAEVVVSDCNRLVRLDFDFWNKKSQRDKVRKINTLIDSLIELRERMIIATPKR